MPFPASLVAVLAQQAANPEAQPGRDFMFPITIGICFLIFYFIVLRPQSKQDKQRRQMLEALKKKDRVLTSGGILATVSDIRDDEVTVRISENPDVKIRIRRSAVVEVVQEPAESAPK